nr:MAG TPA: hypothetical protein [Caudoviricetes sp.]
MKMENSWILKRKKIKFDKQKNIVYICFIN